MAFDRLKKGDKGLRVKALQKRLKNMEPGFDPGPVDGVFGEQTEKAVRKAERWHGLNVNGKVGRDLYRKLHVKRVLRRLRRKRRDRRDFKVIPRSRWNPAPAHGPVGGVVEPVKMYFLHCTVGAEPGPDASMDEEAAAMKQLQATAFARGFYDISYSFVAFQSGRIWEARGWDKAGAHTEGFNSTSYALAFAIACTPTGKVSEDALRAAGKLGQMGRRNGAMVNDIWVRGHREVAAKACPGDYVYNRKDDIQRSARS